MCCFGKNCQFSGKVLSSNITETIKLLSLSIIIISPPYLSAIPLIIEMPLPWLFLSFLFVSNRGLFDNTDPFILLLHLITV